MVLLNRLSLNSAKTNYLVIRPKYSRERLLGRTIHIGNTLLARIGDDGNTTSAKFLGIFIDEHLQWKDHIAQINKKISRALFCIKQVKHVLPQDCLRTLYFSLIYSHLSYGLLAWGNANPTFLNRTNMLQKRAIRIVSKSNYNSHTEPLFRSNSVLKLCDMHQYESLMFMYDYKAHNLPISFDSTFPLNRDVNYARITRQSEQFYVPRCYSEYARKLPLFNLPHVWNEWTLNESADTNRTRFKRSVKNILLGRYSEHVVCDNSHCRDCNPNQ